MLSMPIWQPCDLSRNSIKPVTSLFVLLLPLRLSNWSRNRSLQESQAFISTNTRHLTDPAPVLVGILTMGRGISTPSARRSNNSVLNKTKKYDIFIKAIPPRIRCGDRAHSRYSLGPIDLDYRLPTNLHGQPTNNDARDPKQHMYVSLIRRLLGWR